MLSQWKRNLAVAAAAIFVSLFSSPARAAQAAPPVTPSVVKGNGLPRSERDCLATLPAFTRRLERLGLRLLKPIECEEVLGETESFQPVFTAVASRVTVAETAQGAIFSSVEGCERHLRSILSVVADSNEVIVEAGCVETGVAEQESDEMAAGNFQPTVILLKRKDRQPARQVDCTFSGSGAECTATRK